METDVAVIGAGPCGSFSAFTAAKLGAKVVVFEEHPEIGVPNHCAGHVSIKGLRRLGLKLPAHLVENTFRGAVFFSPSCKQFSVRFDSPMTCAVNRALFDQYLAKMAADSGAQFFVSSRVEAPILEHGMLKGLIVKNHGEQRSEMISSKMVIDAEGVGSVFLKRVGLKPCDRQMLVKAVSADVDDVRDVESDSVEVYLGREFADGFYAWLIPKRDGTAKVGLATKWGNPKRCLERFMSKHNVASGKLKGSRVLRLSYHTVSLGGPISKTFANGFLAVGDVVSHVKPTTGGGIVMGLTCARMAGKIAAQATKEGVNSEGFLKRYENEWKCMIDFDMKMMLLARKLLNRFSDHEIDKLFDMARKLRLEEALVSVKELDFQGIEAFRLASSPSVLSMLAYSLFSALV